MRTFLLVLSVLLCGFLALGSVGLSAPVMQSQSFYINDHAGVLKQETRDSMLKAAQELYDKTGVRAVLLTIESLDGQTAEEYAEAVFRSWELDSGGIGLLILLSTEEKRFVIHSYSDISDKYSTAAVDKLAGEGQFDSAASSCFFAMVDSAYEKYPAKKAAEASSEADTVTSEASVISAQEPQASHRTQDTAITLGTINTDVAEVKKMVFYAVLFLFLIFLFLSILSRFSKRRKKPKKNEMFYFKPLYTDDSTWLTARTDDLDHPSGFGGPGNRKAIYLEDVDEADDVGIIKRKNDDDVGK